MTELVPSCHNDQIGLGGDHGLVETLEHVGDFFAADAAVDDGDRMAREHAS